MNTGIDESQWIKPGQVEEYARRRAGISFNHPEPKAKQSSAFGEKFIADAYSQGIIPVTIVIADDRPVAILYSRGILNSDHILAGDFLKNLRDRAFFNLGYPSYREFMSATGYDFVLQDDPKTTYVRITREMKAWQTNIIEQACWPMPGRNTLPWLSHYVSNTILAFDALVNVLDKYKQAQDNARDCGAEVRPKI